MFDVCKQKLAKFASLFQMNCQCSFWDVMAPTCCSNSSFSSSDTLSIAVESTSLVVGAAASFGIIEGLSSIPFPECILYGDHEQCLEWFTNHIPTAVIIPVGIIVGLLLGRVVTNPVFHFFSHRDETNGPILPYAPIPTPGLHAPAPDQNGQ